MRFTFFQLITLACVVCLGVPRVTLAQYKRPNIIFILTDDQRWDALGYAGNEIIQTPEMDRLAKEGTFFSHAFVTTPICAASRASIMTGTYERKHNYTFQQPPLRSDLIEQSYYSRLQEAGYWNGFLGKFGVKFENRLDTTLFDVYKPEYQTNYYRLTDQATTHKHVTDIISDNAIEFIDEAPKDKPFCLSISYYAPHAVDSSPAQYIWPTALDSLYRDVTIPDPLMSKDSDFDALPERVRRGFNRTRWKWRYDSPEKYQAMVKGYYRMITGIDRNLQKIRHELDEKGIADNTIIILMGDNGYFLGERQLAGKWLMYEPSLRVPLIIYNPTAKDGQGEKVEDMVLNIDIAPTILDLAGLDRSQKYHGYSLLDYTRGNEPQEIRESFLCEHLWDFEPIPPSEGIRTNRYKYFRYVDNPEWEELYDLENDPQEEVNLVSSSEHRKTLEQLKASFLKSIDTFSK
jgi:arylsulfatase A-like enzyme